MIKVAALKGHYITVYKDTKPASSESQLLYWLKKYLQARGIDIIKRLMWVDGHLTSETQHYLRIRDGKDPDQPHVYIHHDLYQIRDAKRDFNTNGHVAYQVTPDVYQTGQDSIAILADMLKSNAIRKT